MRFGAVPRNTGRSCSRRRRPAYNPIVPLLLYGWEFAVQPIPWTSLRSTIVFVVAAVATVQATVHLREKGLASLRACASVLLFLCVAVALAMLYVKSLALLFFHLLIAVAYGVCATTEVRARSFFVGTGTCVLAVVAMNGAVWVRLIAFAMACALAISSGRFGREVGRADDADRQ